MNIIISFTTLFLFFELIKKRSSGGGSLDLPKRAKTTVKAELYYQSEKKKVKILLSEIEE